jgi:hypothetical protein
MAVDSKDIKRLEKIQTAAKEAMNCLEYVTPDSQELSVDFYQNTRVQFLDALSHLERLRSVVKKELERINFAQKSAKPQIRTDRDMTGGA